MKSNKKKFNCGSDFLIPRDEWGTEADIQGGDEHLLKSPIMNRAFNKILEIWRPRHKMALVSLCTSTRPYSKSRKWKTFKELFGDDCDLIICSFEVIQKDGFPGGKMFPDLDERVLREIKRAILHNKK